MHDQDKDPQEPQEWQASLDAVIQHSGRGRAAYLLQCLVDRAVDADIKMPPAITTPNGALAGPSRRRRCWNPGLMVPPVMGNVGPSRPSRTRLALAVLGCCPRAKVASKKNAVVSARTKEITEVVFDMASKLRSEIDRDRTSSLT